MFERAGRYGREVNLGVKLNVFLVAEYYQKSPPFGRFQVAFPVIEPKCENRFDCIFRCAFSDGRGFFWEILYHRNFLKFLQKSNFLSKSLKNFTPRPLIFQGKAKAAS